MAEETKKGKLIYSKELLNELKDLKELKESLVAKGWLNIYLLPESGYIEIAHQDLGIADKILLSAETCQQVHNILQKEVEQSISHKIIQAQQQLDQNVKSPFKKEEAL